MAKFVLEEVPEFSVLPVDSIIQVTCTEIKEVSVPGKDGKDGWDKLEFTFQIDGVPDSLNAPELVGTKIWGSVGARFTTHVDNKLRQWAIALLNMELNEGFELDTDVLINRKARAVTGQYQKKAGSFQHNVSGLLPLVQAPSQAAPVAAAPQAPQAQRPGDIASEAVAAYAQQPVLATGWDDDPPPF